MYRTFELYHYGTPQKPDGSGSGRYRKDWGFDALKGVKCSKQNLSSWGNSEDNNILYITGASGSGKSTLAEDMKTKRTRVIHLDLYFDHDGNDEYKDKAFNKFLKDNGVTGRLLPEEKSDKLLTEFGKKQFKTGNRVIVEGVQLLDETLFPDKTFFKGKPLIIMKTNTILSAIRRNLRDQVKITPSRIFEEIKNMKMSSKLVNDLETQVMAQNGQRLVTALLMEESQNERMGQMH